MESVLKIDNLKYKDILKDITFSLDNKSFNILIGPNGSGKTTLVNCIRGLLKYDGNINIFNNNIKQKNSFNIYREVGFFTDEEILLEGNVLEELLNLLKNLDYNEERAKKMAFALAKKLDITGVLYKRKKELLDYEKTLVSFVFSVIYEPKLLIIDNDLENLDEKYKEKIFNYIKNQKKITVLFITNNSDYFYMANNFLFLKDGKIMLYGNLEEVIKSEKTFIKCGSSLPFSIDLSNKLISYELLTSIHTDIEKMVNEIWK